MKDTIIDTDEVKNKVANISSQLNGMFDDVSTISTNLSLLASIWNGKDGDKSIETLTDTNRNFSSLLTSLSDYKQNLEVVLEKYEEIDNADF